MDSLVVSCARGLTTESESQASFYVKRAFVVPSSDESANLSMDDTYLILHELARLPISLPVQFSPESIFTSGLRGNIVDKKHGVSASLVIARFGFGN